MSKAVSIVADALLPSLVKEAAAALSRASSAAEVLAARDMATAIYDAAKRSARLQRAKAAHDELVSATYRVQADSLEIESMAKRRLADEFDAARPAEASRGGRPKTVPAANGFTAAEVGLSRKEVFEARQMRDVIEQDPGIVRRALDQMLAAGSEPTRAGLKRAANLRAAVGTDSATAAERGNNLYETPPEAMRTLLSFKRFTPKVWEPACGKGAISRMLEDVGYEVELADLVDYGTADRHGEVQRVENFLTSSPRGEDPERPDIVTNPPYGTDLNAFVAHALRAHRPRRMALLLNLNFLCGFDDPDRCFAMDEMPPARVYVFSRRLPMMHRVVYDELSRETREWDGPAASSRMNTAWFVWELREVMGVETYDGPTEIMRIDWKVFEHSKPCGPLNVMPVAAVAPKRRARKAVPA
ncbi:SAM-dependent methyltransferase [Mesorhizobium sp. M7A.F.Ca.ET.027.02.1.1]|uniref:SAM-dependent methyltransferase n=1 Tax=Mesorhizobium sp. M7A.F.Ca.ET.027.02.1.1 TaxID=2496655 RepID=UPI0016795513|nr:SAM-dependent methyltransferase [Mesorhizobium sp. M7A.F.Ca.ET.027.02.1.1]